MNFVPELSILVLMEMMLRIEATLY